ncbi:hypothetical protein HaLaN_30834, partial [Haematococcus lacustris]
MQVAKWRAESRATSWYADMEY